VNIQNPIVRHQGPITEVDISRLAREVARHLKPLELILEAHSINSEEWERIQANQIFLTRLAEEAAVWAGNTKDNLRNRIAIKAAIAVEEAMGEAVSMVGNPAIGGEARIKALHFLAKLGQLDAQTMTKDDGSGRVTINILLGGKKLSFDKETNEPKIIEGEVLTPGVSETP
jgi:hypothetical protein